MDKMLLEDGRNRFPTQHSHFTDFLSIIIKNIYGEIWERKISQGNENVLLIVKNCVTKCVSDNKKKNLRTKSKGINLKKATETAR